MRAYTTVLFAESVVAAVRFQTKAKAFDRSFYCVKAMGWESPVSSEK